MRLYERLFSNNVPTKTRLDFRVIKCSQCNKIYQFDRYDYDQIMESKTPYMCGECREFN